MQHKKVMFHFAAVLFVLIFFSVGASAQPPKRTPFKKGYIIACFVLSLSLFFSGCVTKSAQLQELERQASVIQPTTGREVRRSIHDTQKVRIGKPTYAEVRIQYEPIDPHTTEDVYQEIVDILKRNGWEEDVRAGGSTLSFYASLQHGDYPIPMRGHVFVAPGENLVRLRLTHPRP